MKRLAFASLLLLLLSLPSFGQTAEEETDRLRSQLGVDPSVRITVADSPALPDSTPIKVYLAFGLDTDVRAKMLERVADWNKKDGKKYGEVEVVSDLHAADVILAHYSMRDSAQSVTRTTVGSATVYDPATGGTVTRPVARTSSATLIPGYSYIIRPTPTGLEIIWRYLGRSVEHGRGLPGQTMRDHFFDMLKERSKSAKK